MKNRNNGTDSVSFCNGKDHNASCMTAVVSGSNCKMSKVLYFIADVQAVS